MSQENSDEQPIYMDHTRDFEDRVNDIVSRMTLEEKISQMFNDAPKITRLNIPNIIGGMNVYMGLLLSLLRRYFPKQ